MKHESEGIKREHANASAVVASATMDREREAWA